MSFVFHKGEYVTENAATLTRDNRAFRFADGFFESMRVINGKALFFENHFARIKDTIKTFKFNPAENFSIDLLRNQVQGLLQRNSITQGGRVRITFYRKSTGFYLPASDDLVYYIETDPMMDNEFSPHPGGRIVDLYTDFKKDVTKLSIYKTLNCQLYVMAAIAARDKGIDESLIQNNKFAIIESTSSNLFIVSNGVLYTPTLEDGCIAGTMRMNVINLALDNKIKVYECTLNPHNLLSADEMFLTNAVRGIEWVVAYRTKRYYNEVSKKILTLLNEAAVVYSTTQTIE